MSKVEFEETSSGGRYFYRAEGGPVAEMTFSKTGETMIIIDHTEVPELYKGEGIGLMLLTRAVEDTRQAGKKIIPLCPFANAQFHRHPEWKDVWSGH
ncbi:MAG: GNAT family N-acetyltransferase [Pseudomonadota bacterium]